jgi:hypothetical protein
MSKDPQIYDRRKETTPIRTKSHNSDEIVIGRVNNRYKEPIDRFTSNDLNVETIVKHPGQVSTAINQSLSKLNILQKQIDRDTRLALRQKFGRSVPK